MKNKEYRSLIPRLGHNLPRRFAPSIGPDGWARAAGLAGVVAVGMALAQLTWRLVPLPAEGAGAVTSALPHQTGGAAQLSIAELAEGHLFGQALAPSGGAINAPETTLNLTLHGILAIDSKRALAIIASNGADEKPYKAGDTLPGGAVVHEIAADKVILERGGRFETLTLPKEALDHGGAVPVAGDGQANGRLGEIRNRLKTNPAEAVGMNAIQPVMENGRLKGYQLADNPYTPMLRSAGLMPGDVVTKVNGIAVTDQARAAEVVNQLSNAGRIDLEVERGGATKTLSVDLGK